MGSWRVGGTGQYIHTPSWRWGFKSAFFLLRNQERNATCFPGLWWDLKHQISTSTPCRRDARTLLTVCQIAYLQETDIRPHWCRWLWKPLFSPRSFLMSTHQEVERHNSAAEWEIERLGSLQDLPKHNQYPHYCPVGVKLAAALLDFADTITAGSLWGSLESDKSKKQGSLFNLYWGDGVKSLIHLCCKTSCCWLRIFTLALQSRVLGKLNTSLTFGIHLNCWWLYNIGFSAQGV